MEFEEIFKVVDFDGIGEIYWEEFIVVIFVWLKCEFKVVI